MHTLAFCTRDIRVGPKTRRRTSCVKRLRKRAQCTHTWLSAQTTSSTNKHRITPNPPRESLEIVEQATTCVCQGNFVLKNIIINERLNYTKYMKNTCTSETTRRMVVCSMYHLHTTIHHPSSNNGSNNNGEKTFIPCQRSTWYRLISSSPSSSPSY